MPLRLLLVGGVESATGYGRVLRHIGRALLELGEVSCIQVGPEDGQPAPGPVLANPHLHDFGAVRFLPSAVRAHAPDVVLVLHDLAYGAAVSQLLASRDPRCTLIIYGPVEGEIVKPEPLESLNHADAVVLYTRSDAASVSGWLEASRLRVAPSGRGPQICWVPHGVDRAFTPLNAKPDGSVEPAARALARRQTLGEAVAAGISFLVLNANRQVVRKRLDASLRVFAAFAADKPESVKLLFKTTRNKTQTQELQALAQALGIGQRVLWSDALGIPDAPDDASLNLLYNACDVGINTSEGEGWGLIALEHAATGVPQIVPAHAATADLWKGYPGLIDVPHRRLIDGDMFSYSGIDEAAAGAVLERLYVDDAYRSAAGLQALRIARAPDLDWSTISRRWRKLVTELAASRCGALKLRASDN